MASFLMVLGVLLTLLAGSFVARSSVRLMLKQTQSIISAADDTRGDQ